MKKTTKIISVSILIVMLFLTGFGLGRYISNVNSDLYDIDLYGTINEYNVHIKGRIKIEVEPIMTTVVIPSDADDGYFGVIGGSFAECRAATEGGIDSENTFFSIGQTIAMPGEQKVVYRSFIYFNTSSIPNGAIIDSAFMTLVVSNDFSPDDFDVIVQNGQPDYPHKPAIDSDYNRENYSGDGGSVNSSEFIFDTPVDIVLKSIGKTWINKGGITKFILRSSFDIDEIDSLGVVDFYSFEQGASYIPTLTITYHISSDKCNMHDFWSSDMYHRK